MALRPKFFPKSTEPVMSTTTHKSMKQLCRCVFRQDHNHSLSCCTSTLYPYPIDNNSRIIGKHAEMTCFFLRGYHEFSLALWSVQHICGPTMLIQETGKLCQISLSDLFGNQTNHPTIIKNPPKVIKPTKMSHRSSVVLEPRLHSTVHR